MSDQPTPSSPVSPTNSDGMTRSSIDGRSHASEASTNALPAPHVRRSRWPFPLVWLVPLIAAIAAGYYLRGQLLDRGPRVLVHVTDAGGIIPGDTPVRARGVDIGKVVDVRLGKDNADAVLELRLNGSGASFAKRGAQFWVVKADFAGGNLNALTTAISGQYVAATPGNGDAATEFNALARAPLPNEPGLRVTLNANTLVHLGPDSPVYYRGVLAGSVRHARLASDASHVEIDLLIRPRYRALIRSDTVFWRANGIDVDAGLFKGVDLKIGSLRSLLSGGIAFATPPGNAETAADGARFTLSEDEPKGWETWAPNILILPDPAGNEDLDTPDASNVSVQTQTQAPSKP